MALSSRISLAEIAQLRGEGGSWRWTDSPEEEAASPTVTELAECIHFSPGDGRIWLDDRRVILMESDSLGMLRQQLTATLGLDGARGMLTRIGYHTGASDAELVLKRLPESDHRARFLAGARLHALRGMVKVVPIQLELDLAMGTYRGEFIWHNSVEVDVQIAYAGMGTESACWLQTGYAMGYVSTMMGRLVVFREVECRGAGGHVCRIVGKPAEEWPDVEEDLRHINVEEFLSTRAYSAPPARDIADIPMPEKATAADSDLHMVGISGAFMACCHQLKRVAPTQATALFTGESGVGKELFARMLHEISPRKAAAFVSVNCAAIPESLVESELFGVERGAFTHATASRPGRFERANGGTLFLDEIGTLSLVSQGKLLRALQEGIIERIGGIKEVRVDVRVVAATNVDLKEEVRAGRFREDLFFRLNVFPLRLPPLRERREDIPLLLGHFLQRYNQRHSRRATGFTQRAVHALLNYPFPGNIRELQNMVERGVILADDGGAIDLRHLFRYEDIPQDSTYSLQSEGSLGLAKSMDWSVADGRANDSLLNQFLSLSESQSISLQDLELKLIQEAVERCKGNLSAVARLLGLSRAQVAYRLDKTRPESVVRQETGEE